MKIGIGLARSLAFEEILSHWHGGLSWILIATVHTLHWAAMEDACLSPWFTHSHSHTAMGWHGGCLFIAGVEAVCLSPWLTHWHGGWHGGCLFIAITHCNGLAWRLSVYRHGSHTGIHTLAFKEVVLGIGMVLAIYHQDSYTEMGILITSAFPLP